MQENQYQFPFPIGKIGKIGNANGHPAEDYRMSAIPYCQRLMNLHFQNKDLPKNIKSKINS